MKSISLDITRATQFLKPGTIEIYEEKIEAVQKAFENGTHLGDDFLGWLYLPSSITPTFLDEVQARANTLHEECEVMAAADTGGSYLGVRTAIEALGNLFTWLMNDKESPAILFTGNNIGEDYLAELIDYLKDKEPGVISISRPETTTETVLTFCLLKEQCEAQRGREETKDVIVAITGTKKGAVRICVDREEYENFAIPDNVGGRSFVLTPIGLLPIACTGFDIKALVQGAADMEKVTRKDVALRENIAAQHIAVHYALCHEMGKKIEVIISFQPKLHFIGEWQKQPYGKSEGRDHLGVFPVARDFTADLHSMGQWIQEGERSIFETVISIEQPNKKILFPKNEENLDDLNSLAGRRVDEVNKMAELGTRLAHVDGDVPSTRVSPPELNEYYIGQLLHFSEIVRGISRNLLGVNPFSQPGVEAYKKNMFALPNKPGYEAESEAIQERLTNEE